MDCDLIRRHFRPSGKTMTLDFSSVSNFATTSPGPPLFEKSMTISSPDPCGQGVTVPMTLHFLMPFSPFLHIPEGLETPLISYSLLSMKVLVTLMGPHVVLSESLYFPLHRTTAFAGGLATVPPARAGKSPRATTRWSASRRGATPSATARASAPSCTNAARTPARSAQPATGKSSATAQPVVRPRARRVWARVQSVHAVIAAVPRQPTTPGRSRWPGGA
mmetsp:Transcript_18638/g.51097  ORF Transcript_18638/g.51097 Transcript_18638/m.51097 type:complete len:220 (-) Transcript_18638:6-665(-)